MRFTFLVLLGFVFVSCSKVDVQTKTIGVQGIGNIDQELLKTIENTIQEVYDFENVVMLKTKPLPPSAFVNIKSPRYRADTILKLLKSEKPDTIDYIIGILNKDISTTKRDNFGRILEPKTKYIDWGIFGLGYRPGPSCVLSTYRIKSANKSKFLDRMKKVCMHEIGHNLGLKHCTHGKKCVMRDAAETIKTIDYVDLKLCDYCLSLIQ